MNRINIPTISYSEKRVSLNSKTFFFTYEFNDRTSRWYLSISDQDNNPIHNGMALVEDGPITLHLSELNEALGGFLFIVQQRETDQPCGRNNLGVGKDYELVYMSFKESNESVI